jgi:hypothetical protein
MTAAAVAVGASLTTAVSPAEACSCMSSGPACQAYWNTDAVFDATVVRIERVPRDEVVGTELVTISKRLVTLDVRRTWKGLESGPLQVVTNVYEAACGFEFKEGVRYLVFARQGRSGELEVSLCSATREFDGTGEAAEFLATLAKPGSGGRVFGTISGRVFGTITDSAAPADGNLAPPTPFPDVTVTLTGQGRTLTMQARDGKYAFSALPTGSYNLSATAPDGYTMAGWPGTVVIPDVRACAEHAFSLSPATAISGQVVDNRGRGVRRVRVEIVAADTVLPLEYDSPTSAYTDESGYFDIRALPPGRYLVGLNLVDLPGEYRPYPLTLYPGPLLPVHVIDLTLGHVVDLGRWEIPPPVPVVSIPGTIVWDDGTPAAGVLINLRDVTGNRSGRARGAGIATSAADGRFAIDGRERRTYSVMARIGNGPALPIGNVRVHARQGIQPIRIVIQRAPRE